MTRNDIFQWPPSARLFSGAEKIARQNTVDPNGSQFIDASDAKSALQHLAKILGSGDGFCVAHGDLAGIAPARHGQFLTLTGGSSGAPKVIRRTQASWTASFHINRELFALTPDDNLAVFGRLSHSLALYGVLEGLHLGLGVNALAGLRPNAQRTTLAAFETSILYATPTQLRLLSKGHTSTLKNVRLILCGGGRLDQETTLQIKKLCPNADLRVFYGAAETSFITVSDVSTPLGSVGKPYPGVTLDVRGQTGEIWVKSPYLFEGYADEDTHIQRDENGFVSIGELGQLSQDGHLEIHGRKSRVVTIADQNVHLEAVERIVEEQDGVTACAVLAQLDSQKGNRLIAIVEGPANSTLAEHIKRQCRTQLSATVSPKTIHFVDTLPTLASGKTDLVALTHWLEQQS